MQDLNGLTLEGFLKKIEQDFIIEQIGKEKYYPEKSENAVLISSILPFSSIFQTVCLTPSGAIKSYNVF